MKKSAVFLGVLLGVFGEFEPVQAEIDPAIALFNQACSQCHSLDRVTSKTKTKTSWKKTVDRMRKRLDFKDSSTSDDLVRVVNKDESKLIVTYLHSQWGYTDSKLNSADARKKRFREKFTASKTKTDEDRKKRLREKFTASETQTDEDRRKKVREKFTATKARTSDDRRKKFREKFPPTKARTVSPFSRTAGGDVDNIDDSDVLDY